MVVKEPTGSRHDKSLLGLHSPIQHCIPIDASSILSILRTASTGIINGHIYRYWPEVVIDSNIAEDVINGYIATDVSNGHIHRYYPDVLLMATLLQVLPSDVGQRQTFYFFLQPSYWRPHQVGKGSDPGEDPESPLMSSSGTYSLSAPQAML